MTCIVMSNPIRAIVCVSPWARLHVRGHYYWMSFHSYCGPSFYLDSAMTKPYEPTSEKDPIWQEFGKWFHKYEQAEQKRLKAKAKP